jgi:regulator of vacuolar morphogenesis
MAPLKISIPNAQTKTPESGKPYTEYTIKIDHPFPRATSSVSKRYTDFANLDSALRSVVAAPPASLPPKSWSLFGIGSSLGSPEQVEKRRQGLEEYLRAIENSEDARWKTCQVYRQFLGLDDKDSKRAAGFPGSHFGKDRVRDSSDWLDKHSEVKSSLQDARRWLTAREQATAASAQHDAAANAKRSLLRAESLLAALEEGLRRLSGTSGDEWSGEKLGDGEVRRRKDMISSSRKERDGLESVLNTMAAKAALSGSGTLSTPSTSSAAVTAEQKAGLFKGASKPSGRRVLGGAPVETERTRELDNEGVLQLQQQIIQEQDQDLVDLTTVVKRMREMGVAINEEVVQQNALLGLFEEDVQRVDGKIRIAKKRIEKIR